MEADKTARPVVGNRTDEVYQRPRREIVRGELPPRESLSEVEIAERLAVSRTPARESLQRLSRGPDHLTPTALDRLRAHPRRDPRAST